MTNRQSKSNPMEPKVAFGVLGKILAALVALGVAVWFIWGADGTWDALGAVVWTLTARALAASALRTVLALGEAEQARAARAAENTGVWKVEEGGSFTVRFDPDLGVYYVQGWVSKDHEVAREVMWVGLDSLRTLIEEAEAEGMIPEDDAGTRGIRARLMVSGWDDQHGAGIYPR